jgi:16S rRNA (uracil1498-N3)-methyltransferase
MVEPEVTPEIVVAFALVKGDRGDTIVRQLTEVGVDRIVPFVSARSIARPDPDRAARQVERWRRIAREAGMQSRRARLPAVEAVATFAEVAGRPGATIADRHGRPPDRSLALVLVGPEGGWEPAEREQVAQRVALGPQVLRSETAAVTAGALAVALREGLLASPTPK